MNSEEAFQQWWKIQSFMMLDPDESKIRRQYQSTIYNLARDAWKTSAEHARKQVFESVKEDVV